MYWSDLVAFQGPRVLILEALPKTSLETQEIAACHLIPEIRGIENHQEVFYYSLSLKFQFVPTLSNSHGIHLKLLRKAGLFSYDLNSKNYRENDIFLLITKISKFNVVGSYTYLFSLQDRYFVQGRKHLVSLISYGACRCCS